MNRASGKTILSVDDDVAVLLALKKRLSSAGHEVLTATTGESAVELARDGGVDAITLDVTLPGAMDGLQVARMLRDDPRTQGIPIVFVTGSADAAFRGRCEAVGGRYFLSKPYDAELLLHVLDGVFARDELAEIERISRAKRRQPVS